MLEVIILTIFFGAMVVGAFVIGKETGSRRACEEWQEKADQHEDEVGLLQNRINQKATLARFAQEDY